MTIDLKPFCSTDPAKPYASPFALGKFIFACNCHIVIRLPQGPVQYRATNYQPMIDSLTGLSWEHDLLPPQVWVPVPANLPTPRQVTCKQCGGKGLLAGFKGEPCDECSGTGSRTEPVGVELGRQTISEIYLALIAKELPSPLLAPHGAPASPVPLKFKGGLGYLMPMRASNNSVPSVTSCEK